jgi:prepilin-type N-terminal cleavage/methylation domain-containing protein
MVPRRRGFTFAEVLIVMLVIGILVGLAIPRFTNTRGRTHLAALQSDLRNLALAQEAHYFTRGSYGTTLDSLAARPSDGVTLTIVTADSAGWAATASHPMSSKRTCAVFHGVSASRPAPAVTEGEIACH